MNITEFKFLERIKLLYLKHAGNILNIIKELDLPENEENISYIKKLVEKFRKKESRDVSVLIANTLMQHLFLGYNSRVCNLREMLHALEGRSQLEVSACCEAPTKVNDKNNKLVCLACKLQCSSKIIDKERILDVKLGILEQLREEDKELANLAVKMGYTNKIEQPPAPVVKQNNLIIMGGSEGDIKSAKEIANLPPLERDTLIHKLEKTILNIESNPTIEENGQKPT